MIHSEKHEYRFNNTEIRNMVWHYLKHFGYKVPEDWTDVHLEGEPQLLVAYYYVSSKE